MGEDVANSVIILKSSEESLRSLEAFLRGRQWDIFSTSDLKKAIARLVTNPPMYFLISADHPSKKIRAIPPLVIQATNVKIISYCDQAMVASVKRLRELNCKYELMPPVSGPAVIRMVNRIGLDDEEIKKASSFKKQLKDGNPDSSKHGSILAALLKIVDEDSGPAIISASTPSATPLMDLKVGNANNPFVAYEEKKSQEGRAAFDPGNGTDSKLGLQDLYKPEIGADGMLTRPISTKKTYLGKKSGFTKESLLIRGVNQVLDSAVGFNSLEEPEVTAEYAARSYCIIIKIQRFQGYLVASFGEDKAINSELIETIREQLFLFLKTQGEISREEISSLPISLKEMNFEDWAHEQGEFMRKTFHENNQLTLAYFAVEKLLPQFSESVREDMLKIDIDDVTSEVSLNFDIYIHLPANDKFVLYTPKGGVFSEIQKERLVARRVTHVHLKKEDENSARVHCAESYLNDTIKVHAKKAS
jgi:hypothetical protein